MMYLWEVALRAKEELISLNELYFTQTSDGIGYMELALPYLNQDKIGDIRILEVNTFYRFYNIFKNLFSPDIIEYQKFRKSLTNVIIHMLAENDVQSGMTKDEYYKKLLIADIKQKAFGEDAIDIFFTLSREEQGILLNGWLRIYRVGSSLSIFTDMMHGLIEDSIVYHNNDCPNEIIIYTRMKKTYESEQKIKFLIDLFLDIQYEVEIFYEYHFGIFGIDETMRIGEMAMY